MITESSLDPRVKRLPKIGVPGQLEPKAPLDQFGTFEVFVQPKAGKPFQHEGIVHSPNLEMAYVLAKETFTRRFVCSSLYVVDTRHVYVSPMTEGDTDAYEKVTETPDQSSEKHSYEIFHLSKRGKQHVHAGTISAANPNEAMSVAKHAIKRDKIVYNVWAVRTTDIRFTSPEEQDLWITLPEKRYRDAADYKGGDKLKDFLERQKQTS